MKRKARGVSGSAGSISPTPPEPFSTRDRLVQADTRHSYGEERYQLMGKIDERVFVVVYTVRHDAIRIISARKANQREIGRYEDRSSKD